MRIVELHDVNSPSQVIPFDADNFDVAFPQNQGCMVFSKGVERGAAVHESTEEVEVLVGVSI